MFVSRDRTVEEPEFRGLLARNRLAGVDQLLCGLQTHQPDQQSTLDPGDQADTDLRQPQHRLPLDDPEVAGHRQLQAGPERVAPPATDRDRAGVPDVPGRPP